MTHRFPSPSGSKFAGPDWKDHFAPIGAEYSSTLRVEGQEKSPKEEIQKVPTKKAGKQSHRW